MKVSIDFFKLNEKQQQQHHFGLTAEQPTPFLAYTQLFQDENNIFQMTSKYREGSFVFHLLIWWHKTEKYLSCDEKIDDDTHG